MEQQPNLDTVYEALYALYNSGNISDVEKANSWLLQLQKSVHAWAIANELLNRRADVNSSCFGAQMLRNKILYSLYELPQDACSSLRDTLLQYLSKVDENSNSVVIRQLSLAVVDFALQDGTWKNPVTDFISHHDKFPSHVLIEILTVFPEEVERKNMRLGAKRRRELFDEFMSCSGTVNNFLKSALSSRNDKQSLVKVIKCFTSWVNVGITNIPNILDDGVLPKVFSLLKDPPDEIYQKTDIIDSELHDVASDCVCSVLHYSKDRNRLLGKELFELVCNLEPAYHMTVAKESTEKSMNYCRIFSELGEAFLCDMIRGTSPQAPHFSIKALDLILTSVGHHDYEVAAVTFHFWYNLSENLYQCDNDVLCNEFKPYIERLLMALCRQVQMEPDHEGLLEDGDDFKDFRQKVSDVVKDIIFVVSSSHCFQHMFLSLQSNNLTWDQIEAHLFIMTAIARNLQPEENDVVPKAIDAVFKLPQTTHIAVRYTAVQLIGELCEWFDTHPQYLGTALDFIVFCLQQKQLANAAATSLHHVCCASKLKLRDNYAPLIEISRALHTFDIDNERKLDVIKGTMTVVSELPPEEIKNILEQIVWLYLTPLRQLVEDSTPRKAGTNNDPNLWLDRLATVFRHTSPVVRGEENPCAPVLQSILPTMLEILEHYQSESRIMERGCRCLRFAIRSSGRSGSFVLEPLVKQLVSMYSKYPHSCFMYLGSILVDEYGDDTSNWPLLLHMVEAFITPTFNLLQRNSRGIQQYPDVIDDLFRLCCRFLQRLPIPFLQSSAMVPLLECAITSVSLNHREANASVMKFFHELLFYPCNRENDVRSQLLKRILEQHGETLVYNIIYASVFILHTYMLTEVAEVLFDFIEIDKSVAFQWIKTSIEKLPKHTSAGTIVAVNQLQIQDFLEACKTAETVKDLSKALKEFCYYYR